MKPSPIFVTQPYTAAYRNGAAVTGSGSTNDLAVLFGSDRTLEGAQDELARARAAGFTTAAIYLRKGWYASVVTFRDANARALGLPTILNLSKWSRDASPISLSAWCPQRRDSANQDFVECLDPAGSSPTAN